MGGHPGMHTPFRLHGEGSSGGEDSRGPGSLKSSAHSSPSRQISQQLNQQIHTPPQTTTFQRQPKSPSPSRQSSVTHAPVAAPPPDDMEPQNVYFIDSQEQNNENDVNNKLKRMSISSGNRTYRITHEPGSPTRPAVGTKTFRVPTKKGTPIQDDVDLPQPTPVNRSFSPVYTGDENDEEDEVKTEPLQTGSNPDKGFYISFDDDSGPKKPKPPLRAKKMTSRKTSAPTTPQSTPIREDMPFLPVRKIKIFKV